MAVQTSYPGVYIDEFAPGAPIQGVGTSITAFLGPTARGEIAARGDIRLITKVTTWEQFQRDYGDAPVPGHTLWYGVRGFFENGGRTCYVARVSNGNYQALFLTDRSAAANNLVRVRARQPGIPATNITVAVAGKNLIPNATTSLFRPTGALASAPAGRDLTLNAGQGANFRPDDEITIAGGGERVRIVRVTGDVLRIASDLTGAYNAADAVRLANLVPGTRTVRVQSNPPQANFAALLIPGTMLTLTQAPNADSQIVETVQPEFLGGGVTTYRVTFRQGIDIAINMANPTTVQSEEFDIIVAQGAATPYQNLAIDAAHPRYYLSVINDDVNALVRLEPVEPPPPVDAPQNLPANLAATALAGGANENLAALGPNDYIDALRVLERIDDISLVAAPDATRLNAANTMAVQQALITHCEQMAFRFAVLDSRRNLELFGANGVEVQRAGLASARGHAGLYYPWIRVLPAGSGDAILVPPSGHVCGIMARSDAQRGVHKAPANELLRNVVGVERTMSDVDQGLLNLAGINVIRVFSPGAPATLWGARTTSRDTNWQYVNIRRLFNFLELSIERGIMWAVFEPNNLALWQKLKRTITDFLRQQWRDGALFGAEPDDAFYVRIDEQLNPFSEQALGRLHIEIGVRPSYPAEFIIVHIGIWQGGSEVAEA
jgi:phage tail sheath protein FI